MTSAAIRTVVSGVRSSCETSETNRRCIRDRSSSCWILSWRFCAILLKASPSRAMSSSPVTFMRSCSRPGGQPLGDPGGHPHRRDDLPHDEPGDGPEQHDDEQPGGRQRALDQAERLLLLREREEVVQLVRVAVGVVDLLADDQRRAAARRAVGVDDAGVALERAACRVDRARAASRERSASGRRRRRRAGRSRGPPLSARRRAERRRRRRRPGRRWTALARGRSATR